MDNAAVSFTESPPSTVMRKSARLRSACIIFEMKLSICARSSQVNIFAFLTCFIVLRKKINCFSIYLSNKAAETDS